MVFFVLKSQPSSGDDFKPSSETPQRKQRGLFSDEEDSEVSTSEISYCKNLWNLIYSDFIPLICTVVNSDTVCLLLAFLKTFSKGEIFDYFFPSAGSLNLCGTHRH